MSRIRSVILVAGITLALPIGVQAEPPVNLVQLELPLCSELEEAGFFKVGEEVRKLTINQVFLNKKIQTGYKQTRIEKHAKVVGRSYLLADCFPTQWSSVDLEVSLTVDTKSLRAETGWLKFGT